MPDLAGQQCCNKLMPRVASTLSEVLLNVFLNTQWGCRAPIPAKNTNTHGDVLRMKGDMRHPANRP